MTQRLRRHAPWLAAWLLASLVGGWIMAQLQLNRLHDEFDAHTRTVQGLLNQRTAQLDTALSTLETQPAGTDANRRELRLQSVYPQVVTLQRREVEAVWSEPVLQAADAESRRLRRAVLARVELQKGHYTLVQGGDPVSLAMVVDLRSLVPWEEWPMAPDTSPVRVTLGHEGQQWVLQPGQRNDGFMQGWNFMASGMLATPSQPFELIAARRVGWSELPWAGMASWSLLVAVMLLATRAILRRRTDRHRAQELLRLGRITRHSTLGELAAGVTQELSEPLAAAMAQTLMAQRLLAEHPVDPEAAQVAMQEAVDHVHRASDVLERIRKASAQPELGRTQDVNLIEMVRKALDLLQPELRRRDITPQVQVRGSAFHVYVRPVALEQVLHNLLMNALDALDQVPPPERQLWLVLEVVDGFGQLSLQDNGPGMSNDDLPHVFEPFFSTRDGALGLGLSLSESLTSAMGGTLMAFNRVPRGSEFVLKLPLASMQ